MASAGELTVRVRLVPEDTDARLVVAAFALLSAKLSDNGVHLSPDELDAVRAGEAALRRSIRIDSA